MTRKVELEIDAGIARQAMVAGDEGNVLDLAMALSDRPNEGHGDRRRVHRVCGRGLSHADALSRCVDGRCGQHPRPELGEAVQAEILLTPGAAIPPETLIASVKEGIGPIKTLKSLKVVTELPRSSVGVVLWRAVRARYWTDGDRAIG